VSDDPLARQAAMEAQSGKSAKRNGGGKAGRRADPMSRPHKPSLDEMGPHSERVMPHRITKSKSKRSH
jgi:excinuclease ABC subunit B